MAQEFVIKSPEIEDKINQLLPSQGGFQAGVDFSASTMVVPIIDLTETAEGSNVRPDLQKAISHDTATAFSVSDTTTTIINTTGYFLITGSSTVIPRSGTSLYNKIQLNDGATTKTIWAHQIPSTSATNVTCLNIDLIVFLGAGDSCIIESLSSDAIAVGSTRQIASIDGTLVNP